MAVPKQPQRKSVPTGSVEAWWAIGWAYVMPDFDQPDHSVIEWLSDQTAPMPDSDADQLAAAVLDELARVG